MESASNAYAVCQALPDSSAASTAVSAISSASSTRALHEQRERLEREPAGDRRTLSGGPCEHEASAQVIERVVDVLEPERGGRDALDEVDALDEPLVGQHRERVSARRRGRRAPR